MLEVIQFTLNQGARHVTQGGRKWLVAPMTTIVPGVLSGSKGPLLYRSSDTKAALTSWNNIPITVYHPLAANGQHVSASSYGVLERQGIGHLRNTRYERKLKHEGWFDVSRLTPHPGDPLAQQKLSILNALQSGQPMELSTGLYTDNIPEEGTHNGRQYTHVAKNHIPDHLAILPDQTGACSVSDGCGLNVNRAGPKEDGCGDGG